jgi:hypothetical protein
MFGAELVPKILARGCIIGSPADTSVLVQLEKKINCPIHSDIKDIYNLFNGIQSYDEKSLISIWSIEEILAFKPEHRLRDCYFPFGDIMFNSEIISCSSFSPHLPVVSMESDREIASSLYNFWDGFVSGRFDLRTA